MFMEQYMNRCDVLKVRATFDVIDIEKGRHFFTTEMTPCNGPGDIVYLDGHAVHCVPELCPTKDLCRNRHPSELHFRIATSDHADRQRSLRDAVISLSLI